MKQSLVAATVLLLLSACGADSPVPRSSGAVCNSPLVPQFTMSSPTAGSTGVAYSMPELIFSGTLYSSQYAPPSITLTTASGFSYTTTAFFQITGVDTPGSYYGIKLPALSAATTYSVFYTVQQAPKSSACGTPTTVPEGSFTTQ